VSSLGRRKFFREFFAAAVSLIRCGYGHGVAAHGAFAKAGARNEMSLFDADEETMTQRLPKGVGPLSANLRARFEHTICSCSARGRWGFWRSRAARPSVILFRAHQIADRIA
jgi:hypothetical protein